MKKLILGLALATALATPVLAQSFDPDYGTGNVSAAPSLQRFDNEATGSLAYAPRGQVRHHRDAYQARGVDQDPNIALQQRRDDLQY